MAPSSRFLVVLLVLILAFQLTESKSNHKLTRSRGSTTRRISTRRTYHGNTGYSSSGPGLSWWQIVLIIGGIVLFFAFLYCCIRQCSNREPESDTPGINTTRDQIQLRDHKTVNHFPSHYNSTPGFAPQEGGMYQPPTDIMYPPTTNSTYPPSNDVMYPPNSSPAPPSYGNVIGFHKEPIDNGDIDGQILADQWEDDVNFKRKDFGVI